MKKMRLDVDEIRVTRFETHGDGPAAGTVLGQEAAVPTGLTACFRDTCWWDSCITGPPPPCQPCRQG
ncbi:MAG TPA: hypothetical protein VFJ82_14635 [Longimicrobium sp.]|nr:hypothetical protein [Longimicrobium sp.]